MYKVFVNDIPIIISADKEIGEKYTSFPLKTVRLKKVIKKILKGELLFVHLYHPDETKHLKLLFKKMKVITAAGGLVLNSKKEILFIYRNHRWDLPKGKTEKNEDLQTCAIREVEEETGVQDLEITRFITRTYHVFRRKGKLRLKETYWYEMYTDYDGELTPELSEGIKKVKWKNNEKSQKALQKSYANIKMLFPEKFLAGKSENWVA
ncbi:NUDIX domain-containing protein [Gramella sp. GC03-9]|uniref:NUDIX domain-containing protein n=1 Tax=Christiangramia oceanisediminis TaxID=2920386 RepID=A0A9X2L030_9FLAO|nr:NUDIX domain-containing protein [Gramella oceanisediminis]MCP9201391.1 NUDIX domain-containing protein [Gramella oceanisediminis]